jgi:hypothetical protein
MSQSERYRQDLVKLYMVCDCLAEMPLDEYLKAISRADSVGHIIDPTSYKQGVQAMHEDRSVIEAALPLARLGRHIQQQREQRKRS